MSHHFTGVCFRVTQGNVAVEVDLVIIPNELEDSDVESAGERYAVLSHADGVVLDVWTPGESQTSKEQTGLRSVFLCVVSFSSTCLYPVATSHQNHLNSYQIIIKLRSHLNIVQQFKIF